MIEEDNRCEGGKLDKMPTFVHFFHILQSWLRKRAIDPIVFSPRLPPAGRSVKEERMASPFQDKEHLVRLADHRLRPARDEGQVLRRIAEDLPLVEHPLKRPTWKADERTVEHGPIEPEVDGHDRGRGHVPRGVKDRLEPRNGAAEHLVERKPRDGGNHDPPAKSTGAADRA